MGPIVGLEMTFVIVTETENAAMTERSGGGAGLLVFLRQGPGWPLYSLEGLQGLQSVQSLKREYRARTANRDRRGMLPPWIAPTTVTGPGRKCVVTMDSSR